MHEYFNNDTQNKKYLLNIVKYFFKLCIVHNRIRGGHDWREPQVRVSWRYKLYHFEQHPSVSSWGRGECCSAASAIWIGHVSEFSAYDCYIKQEAIEKVSTLIMHTYKRTHVCTVTHMRAHARALLLILIRISNK
jgi:hypothetical protein